MTQDERAEFAALLAGAASIYGRRISEPALEAYWSDLESHPLSAIRAAFEQHRRTPGAGKMFPTPAHLLEYLAGVAEDRAMIAWRGLLATAGQHDCALLDDAVAVAATRAIGGWARIGRCPERELSFLQREFIRQYVLLSRAPPRDVAPLVYDRGLAGTFELPEPARLNLHAIPELRPQRKVLPDPRAAAAPAHAWPDLSAIVPAERRPGSTGRSRIESDSTRH